MNFILNQVIHNDIVVILLIEKGRDLTSNKKASTTILQKQMHMPKQIQL